MQGSREKESHRLKTKRELHNGEKEEGNEGKVGSEIKGVGIYCLTTTTACLRHVVKAHVWKLFGLAFLVFLCRRRKPRSL